MYWIGEQNTKKTLFPPPPVLCDSRHPILAVVFNAFWKEDCSLLWHLGKPPPHAPHALSSSVNVLTDRPASVVFQTAVPSMILVVSFKSNLIVTYFVSFCAGVGVASAYLMSWWDPRRLLTHTHRGNTDSYACSDPFQVHAARCGRRFQTAEPQIYRPRSHLLLFLCLLHQVHLWDLSGHFHSQFTVCIFDSADVFTNRARQKRSHGSAAVIQKQKYFMISLEFKDFLVGLHMRCIKG